ncbi:chromosome partitioning protein [Methylophilus rhizosphaerae]|uniref:Chromosome partitioning protein n=1 Tax=Methylophilus rhizosphaerae TaxID=492660 RepID=A0A1G9F0J5_9PROT|nr:ParA family protein [Methylophilus rhizosphaerae]SDK81976.1 chromosome partitioning protein [Methylophilus rhizosphaerae]
MLKIAIFNQKAGVGSTTTALNLAAAWQRKRQPVALIDMDPQAQLTEIYKHVGLEMQQHLFKFYQAGIPLVDLVQPLRNGLQLIPATKELMKVDTEFGRGPATLKRLGDGLAQWGLVQPDNTVFMDCIPGIGVISLSAMFASDLVLVPVSADYLSIHSAAKVGKALNALEPVLKRRIARRYLLTRADKRKEMTSEVEQEMRRLFGHEVLLTKISEQAAFTESARIGQHIFEYDAASQGARDYMTLYFELLDVIKQLPATA